MDITTTLSTMDLEESIQANNQRLDSFEYSQHALESTVAASNQNFHDQLDKLNLRQNRLEAKMDARFDSLTSLMHERFPPIIVPAKSDLQSAGNSSSPLVPPGYEHVTA
ncbi:hypothetical protein L195_g037642, partial [Trifolium pratense]